MRRKYGLEGIWLLCHNGRMSWEVEYTDEFGSWWNSLSEDEQDSINFGVRLLQERGPHLKGLLPILFRAPVTQT
jgi:hypothetical protein